jgi:voltage-gated potassium channel
MFSLLINVYRLLKAIYLGLKNDKEFRILLLLLLSLLIGSTFFYTRYETWSAIDALYFSVMTMSTIGYGDIVPTTVFTKIFTIVFCFLSTGIFLSLNAKIVILIINRKHPVINESGS